MDKLTFQGILYEGMIKDSANTIARRILDVLGETAETGQEIGKKTEGEMYQFRELLRFRLGREEVRDGFLRILMGKHATYVLSKYRDLIAELIPCIRPMFGCQQQGKYHPYDVWEHTLASLIHTPQDKIVRLVMFFHDIGKPSVMTYGEDGIMHFYGHEEKSAEMAKACLERLAFDEETVALVTFSS